MSINRAPFTGAVTGHHMQGKFVYYRKGAAVSGVTDVLVVCDGATMGLMSPTEHFSLNSGFKYIEFKPVDPLCVGEFVLADTAEEYGSSAVAGSVTISGGSVAVANTGDSFDFEQTRTDAALAFSGTLTGVSSTGSVIYLVNNPSNTKTVYVDKVNMSCVAAPLSLSISAYSGLTGALTGGTTLPNKKIGSPASSALMGINTTGLAGLVLITPNIFADFSGVNRIDVDFETPLALPPGTLIVAAATSTPANTATASFQIHEK